MCIRDSLYGEPTGIEQLTQLWGVRDPRDSFWLAISELPYACLLYTSDAADERSSGDLGGRRILKKKTIQNIRDTSLLYIMQKQDQHL
mgnify:CR=1 FL=1